MPVGALAAYAGMNFALDAGVFLVAGRVAGERLDGRIGAAAAVGVAYALVPRAWNGGLAGVALSALVMVLIAWGTAPPRRVARRLAAVGTVAVLLGGTVLGVATALGLTAPSRSHPVAWAGLVALAAASLMVTRVTAAWRLGRVGAAALDLEVEMGERRVRLHGFVDTGNRLREPLARAPVIVAEAVPLAGLLPIAARPAYLSETAAGLDAERLAAICPNWSHRLAVVPYRAVGASGLLTAIRPDGLWLVVDGGRVAVRALIALSPRPMAWSGADALVPPDLVPEASRIGA